MSYVSSLTKKVANKTLRRIKRYVAPLIPASVVDVPALEQMLSANECGDLEWFIGRHAERPVIVPRMALDVIRKRFTERYPDQFVWLLERTEACLNNAFAEFNGPFVNMANEDGTIRWFDDITSGATWPSTHFLKTPIVLDKDTSDIKGVWELSRFQFAPNLAQMEILTGDNLTYRTKFIELVDDWQRGNPYATGPNWNCSMEVAIRAINMLTAAEMFNNTSQLPVSFMKALMASLFQHGRHINENQETISRGLNTNHYLANLIGLLALGQLFEPLTEAAEWKRHAIAELAAEIECQTTADGFCYESSSAYHLLTFEFYLFALTVCRQNNLAIPLSFVKRLKKTAEATQTLTAPNARLVNMGDNDSGRLFKYARRDDCDPRWLLCWAALEGLIVSEGAGAVAQCAESVWLFGHKEAPSDNGTNPDTTGRPRRVRSKYLRDSGQIVMRSGGLWMHVNAGKIGSGGIGSHKHNDELAISCVWDDQEVITDPGMFCYTRNETERNRLRSVSMHSTVAVAGHETNRIIDGYPFALRRDGAPRVASWLSSHECDLLQAEHDCYRRLPGSPLVSRTIYFDKVAKIWLIRDRLKLERVTMSRNELELTTSLITSRDVDLRGREAAMIGLSDDKNVSIRVYSDGATLECEDCILAPSYNVASAGTKISIKTPPGMTDVIWGIFPNTGKQRKDRDFSLLREKFRLLEWPLLGLPAHNTGENANMTKEPERGVNQ